MKLSIQSQEGDVYRLGLAGEITQRQVSPLDDPLVNLLGEGCYRSKVVIDMHEVDLLDSSGVSWLLACRKRFSKAGGMFVIHSLSPFASDVLRMLNMHLVFRMADSEAQALAAVQETCP